MTAKRPRSRQRSQKAAQAAGPQTIENDIAAPAPLPDALAPAEEERRDGALPLPAALELAAAGALARTLLARRRQTVVIDAAAVLNLSAPGAQVLMSAAATWLADDTPFSIENCSEKMRDDLRVLGIDPSILNIEAAAQ